MDNLSLKDLYRHISNLENFQPSEKVNALFTRLVKFALNEKSQNTLTVSEKRKLQLICSQAEYALEKYWAKKLIKSNNIHKTINEFPYIKNYQKLTQMEWFSLLACTNHKDHQILFVGGGPLPLTAIMLAMKYDTYITVLDSSLEACILAKSVIEKYGLQKKIEIVNSDAMAFERYVDFNVIIIAALAGVKRGVKNKILQKIKLRTKKGSHILARSSWGMREILYRPLDRKPYKLFKPVIEVRPQNSVINSFTIFANE